MLYQASGHRRLSDGDLSPEIVLNLASILELKDGAFLVGGQALNIWAEHYSSAPDLAAYGPYTSKDIDYFGYQKAAQKLADALGGTVRTPELGDATPQTAIVDAVVNGQEMAIDFLGDVKGVKANALQRSAVELILRVVTEQGEASLAVPIMHPLHCLQSRVANVIDLGRRYPLALRQLNASPIVLREYISETLESGDHPEATATLEKLFQYLRSDYTGRRAHEVMETDPATILDHFADDPRIDPRYRANTLANMRRQLIRRRSILARVATAIGLSKGG